jgi:Aldehyde dehydrogenase family
VRAIAFAAIGTAGQRCTTLRRLFVHQEIYAALLKRLQHVYVTAPVGNPLEDDSILVGPLIDEAAFTGMQKTLAEVRAAGARITGGERCHAGVYPAAYYVRPALVELTNQTGPVRRETFAPVRESSGVAPRAARLVPSSAGDLLILVLFRRQVYVCECRARTQLGGSRGTVVCSSVHSHGRFRRRHSSQHLRGIRPCVQTTK